MKLVTYVTFYIDLYPDNIHNRTMKRSKCTPGVSKETLDILNAAIAVQKVRKKDLAKKLKGISRPYLCLMLSGRKPMAFETASKLFELLRIGEHEKHVVLLSVGIGLPSETIGGD